MAIGDFKKVVQQKTMIDGNVVESAGVVGDLNVYYHLTDEADIITFYFCNGVAVISELTVEADMCQGAGYIADYGLTRIGEEGE